MALHLNLNGETSPFSGLLNLTHNKLRSPVFADRYVTES
jgi:hypothetical protein